MPIIGLDNLLAKLERMGSSIESETAKAVQRTTDNAAADAVNNAPASKFSQSGAGGAVSLKGSITGKVEGSGETVTGTVTCNAPHAGYVEFGTGIVGASNNGGTSPAVNVSYTSRESWVYPAGVDENGDTQFYTTSGQPARPFMYPAAVQNQPVFAAEMVSSLRKIAKGGG